MCKLVLICTRNLYGYLKLHSYINRSSNYPHILVKVLPLPDSLLPSLAEPWRKIFARLAILCCNASEDAIMPILLQTALLNVVGNTKEMTAESLVILD